uniref:KRAB domain-containing protein n=1 Tax=Meleagris gallopavo TaxID=9103 RepID=A0A803YC88_MELGA
PGKSSAAGLSAKVAVYFSREEWALLDPQCVASLGAPSSSPVEVQRGDISVWWEKEFCQNCSDKSIGTIERCYKGMEEHFLSL